MTMTLDCPWCDGPVALLETDETLACDACGIVADVASDDRPSLAAAA